LSTMSFSLNCCTNCWRLLMFLLRSARMGGEKGQRAAPASIGATDRGC
jgi:hypothetical protein